MALTSELYRSVVETADTVEETGGLEIILFQWDKCKGGAVHSASREHREKPSYPPWMKRMSGRSLGRLPEENDV